MVAEADEEGGHPVAAAAAAGPAAEEDEALSAELRVLVQEFREGLREARAPGGGHASSDTGFLDLASNPWGMHVCARVRPAGSFPPDLSRRAPALSCVGARLVLHRARREIRSQRLVLANEDFALEAAFDESAQDAEVHAAVGRAACQRAASGGCASVVAYGQTSAGKTHSVRGLLDRVPADLFEGLRAAAVAEAQVACSAVELRGNACFDLLADLGEVGILEDADGGVNLKGAEKCHVETADDLTALFARAAVLRATASTERNEQSSRSHAIYRVAISAPSKAGMGHDMRLHGQLTIVDLAGSERGSERGHDVSKDRLKESVEINQSLMALKECMRKRSSGASSVPFRQSRLTMLLREAFEFSDALCVLIACVSPLLRDADHTANTLRYATHVLQREQQLGRPNKSRPETWSKAEVRAFVRTVRGGNRSSVVDAFSLSGPQLLTLSREEMMARCEGDDVGGAIFDALQEQRAGAAGPSSGAAPSAGKSFTRPTVQPFVQSLACLKALWDDGVDAQAAQWEEVDKVVQGWRAELARLQSALAKQQASAQRSAALDGRKVVETRSFWQGALGEELARQRRVYEAIGEVCRLSGLGCSAEAEELLERGGACAAELPVPAAKERGAKAAALPSASAGNPLEELGARLAEARAGGAELDSSALAALGEACVAELVKFQEELARSLPRQRNEERARQRSRDALDDNCRDTMHVMRSLTDNLLQVLVKVVDGLPIEQTSQLSDDAAGLAEEYRERRATENAYRSQFPSAVAEAEAAAAAAVAGPGG